MIGSVDQKGRAVLTLNVKANETANPVSLTVWVDMAFDGELVFSKSLIRQFALPQSAAIEATLADGQTVVLETYSCLIDWFGDWR